jgi:ABC-type multidrug transport system ATPase subunit
VNLDISSTEVLANTLQQLKGSKTLLITSHNLDLIAPLCDRFLIMENRKISLSVSKEDFASMDALKGYVKDTLTIKNKSAQLDWLVTRN